MKINKENINNKKFNMSNLLKENYPCKKLHGFRMKLAK